jgi:hypothetical protein
MATKETYGMSEFFDAWEKVVNPPPLSEQLADLAGFSDSIRIYTPAASSQAQSDWRSIMAYRHVFCSCIVRSLHHKTSRSPLWPRSFFGTISP